MKIVFEQEEDQSAIEFSLDTEPCKPRDLIQMKIGETTYWVKAGDIKRLAAAIESIREKEQRFPVIFPTGPIY